MIPLRQAMNATSFRIPDELNALIATGVWPTNEREANRQNLHSLVSAERIQVFAPDEHTIFLYPPPFSTVGECCRGSERIFWNSPIAAPSEISFDHALVIGDFGLGSDAPILLNYEKSRAHPSVLRLRWDRSGGRDNHWVEIAPTFAQFIELLGLRQTSS
jgi:hypothetical protein